MQQHPILTENDLSLSLASLVLQNLLPSLHHENIVDTQYVDLVDTLAGELGVTGEVFGDLL